MPRLGSMLLKFGKIVDVTLDKDVLMAFILEVLSAKIRAVIRGALTNRSFKHCAWILQAGLRGDLSVLI